MVGRTKRLARGHDGARKVQEHAGSGIACDVRRLSNDVEAVIEQRHHRMMVRRTQTRQGQHGPQPRMAGLPNGGTVVNTPP